LTGLGNKNQTYTLKKYFLTETRTEVTGLQYPILVFHSSTNEAV